MSNQIIVNGVMETKNSVFEFFKVNIHNNDFNGKIIAYHNGAAVGYLEFLPVPENSYKGVVISTQKLTDDNKESEILKIIRQKQSAKGHLINALFQEVEKCLNKGILKAEDIATQLTIIRDELIDAYAGSTEFEDIPF
ncbi:hypothetical protein JEO96_05680 [Proteus mirabilis]|nr:hypothetical protein [Proteus mirabilis]